MDEKKANSQTAQGGGALPRKLIAVFGAAMHEEKEFSFLAELERAGRDKGYFVLAFSFAWENMANEQASSAEQTLIRLAEELPLSAIVIMRESLTSELLFGRIKEVGERMRVPVFSVEKPVEGCVNITFKYKDGFREIVRHVVEDHGCRKVNMIAGFQGNEFSEERIEAYKEVLASNGIPFEEERLGYGDFWDRPTRAVVQKILDSGELPEAIVCANDSMAITTCSMLKEAGVRVPEDVIVTGFDGITSGLLNDPAISSVIPDYAREVGFVIEGIEASQRGEEPSGEERRLDFVLRPNKSCGCTSGKERSAETTVSEISESFSDMNWFLHAMDRMISRAATMDSIAELPPVLHTEIGMWGRDFCHVGIFTELACDEPKDPSGHTYTTFYRCERGEFSSMSATYSEQVFLPGLARVLADESAAKVLMVRLLHTAGNPHGYIVGGFETLSNRAVRRCEELGMFLSTAINAVLANSRLRILNQKLLNANKEIEKISVTDYLTGIYNRRGFLAELEGQICQEENRGNYLTVFSIDMDGLKYINDNFGHEEGDFAIKTMAAAIRKFAARNGFCSRYGGDEFACALISEEELSLSADEVRERLENAIAKRPEAAAKEYPITASIGSCCRQLEGEMDVEGMIKIADEAMYADKLLRKKGRK